VKLSKKDITEWVLKPAFLGTRFIGLQYPGQVWKLPMLEGWLVVANGRDKVEDIRKAPQDQLSGIRSNPVVGSSDIVSLRLCWKRLLVLPMGLHSGPGRYGEPVSHQYRSRTYDPKSREPIRRHQGWNGLGHEWHDSMSKGWYAFLKFPFDQGGYLSSTQEWVSVPIFGGLIEVISRITTRAFLGVDLCKEYFEYTFNSTLTDK